MKEAVFNLFVLAISGLVTVMTVGMYQAFWNTLA